MLEQNPNTFFWRARIFLSVLLVSVIVVLARLVDLQLGQVGWYQAAAQDNSNFRLSVPANRGILLDRYGEALVKNSIRYWQKQDLTTFFSKEVLVDDSSALGLLATQAAQIRKEYSRWYPHNSSGAHVIGYVGPISKDELLLNENAEITDLVGRTGLERAFNTLLTGTAGEIEYEVTALGEANRVIQEKPMIPGAVIKTTLDPYLTAIAQKAMENNKGAVIIADAKTGALLAVVSSPSYDPNVFTKFTQTNEEQALRRQQITSFLEDPDKALFNRAIAGEYPPGSVFKLVTAIAGLESESITPSTVVKDEGILKVGEYAYANWYFSQYGGTEGEISLERALARSNDIYFYKAAEFTGPDAIATWARNIGFGSPTGIELTGEASGLVPDPEWKERTLHEQWYLGNTYHYGIGQGDLLVSPIQVSQLFQTIANQGVRCQPHISEDGKNECHSLGMKEENVTPILRGMIAACSTGGTAFPFFAYNDQFEPNPNPNEAISNGMAACKTGTAEFGGADERGFRKTHGWFSVVVGIPELSRSTPNGELDETVVLDQTRDEWLAKIQQNPLPKEFVITVLVESDEEKPYKEGSADAAPIALELLEWMRGK